MSGSAAMTDAIRVCPFCGATRDHVEACPVLAVDARLMQVLTRLGDLVADVHELWETIEQLRRLDPLTRGGDDDRRRLSLVRPDIDT